MTQPAATAPNDAVGCVSISGAVAEFAAAAAVFAAKIARCTRCCGQRVWCDCPAACICRPGDELHAPVQPADCPRHRAAPGTLDDLGGPLCECGERFADHVHGPQFGCGNFRRA